MRGGEGGHCRHNSSIGRNRIKIQVEPIGLELSRKAIRFVVDEFLVTTKGRGVGVGVEKVECLSRCLVQR